MRDSRGTSKTFRFDETKYYRFGLLLGIRNVLHNGFQLGVKKTAGKLLQPVNSYTRFPEYHFVESETMQHLRHLDLIERPKVLDVGSPKCFGLYLAFHFDIEIHLTDIDLPSMKEAELLWNGIKDQARGRAFFRVQDARALNYSDEEFHAVYSMSVIEHVEGTAGDSESMGEMLRVLKPGGLLVVTVPIGQTYLEQDRIGFRGAARETNDRNRFFFQRIYTPRKVEERIFNMASGATLEKAVTVWRKGNAVSKIYRRLGTNSRGLLGCFNPLLSVALNDSREGIFAAPSDYGALHSTSDLYGDLMLAWNKGPISTDGTLIG
jgi:SAM-dependent methyltransferase